MVTVVNEKAYKPLSDKRVVELRVRLYLDPVPGAWHEPEDFMNWLVATHSYVQSVETVEGGVTDKECTCEMPQTPFLDALGIKAPRVKMDEIRKDAAKAKEAFKGVTDMPSLITVGREPVEAFDGFEFSPRLDDSCQYSTMYRGDKPVATLQRRRVLDKTGPVWTLYATDGALIAKTFLGRTYSGVAKWASYQFSRYVGE